MSSYWWVDRALPGIVASSIMAVVLAVSHLLLRRHVTRTARQQRDHAERLAAEQTAAITGRDGPPAP